MAERSVSDLVGKIERDRYTTINGIKYIKVSLFGYTRRVKIGSPLADPIRVRGSDESYWYTPMYFSEV